jgi:hypothetical protein
MTYTSFCDSCSERTIDPDIALENEKIREALQDHNDTLVILLLDSEF